MISGLIKNLLYSENREKEKDTNSTFSLGQLSEFIVLLKE